MAPMSYSQKESTLKMNVDCMIFKPLTPSDLFDSLTNEKFLEQQLNQAQLTNTLTKAPIKDSSEPVLLLVEDNKINQVVASALLKEAGVIFDIAENGEQAISKLNAKQNNPYKLILMDCQMPVMDGLEATREIRKLDDPIVSKVPIVAVSSGIKSMNERDCMEAGMDDYVAKPLNQQILTGVLSRNIPTSLMKNAVDPNDVKLMQELMISDEMV